MSAHPFLVEQFQVPWSSLLPDRVEPDLRVAIKEAEERLAAICALPPADRDYGKTFGALEELTESLDRGWGRLNHLDAVRNDEEQRTALNKMLPVVTAFRASIPLHDELWAVLKSFAESPSAAELDPVRARYVQETCADFRDAGADLSPDDKKRMAGIQSALAEATQKFSENVLDSTNEWELVINDESRLAGLPESARAAARAAAEAKGLGSAEAPAWRFTLQFPSMFPVLQYADDDALRREVYEGTISVGRGGDHDNSALIWKILRLRREKAELLGCRSFADLVLKRRMARSGSSALRFVEDLHDRIDEAFRRECADLQAYKASRTAGEPGPLDPWETAYWAERRRKELFDLNDEDLRPYFPVDQVMEGLFGLASRLFGITIAPAPSAFHQPGTAPETGPAEVWHPEVRFYEIRDQQSQQHLGSFYADWHPRESKRNGAWMNYLETGRPDPREPHLGLICGNLTKPLDDHPALLTHDEVQTIFHEFGHLLHQLLSEVPVKSLAGVNVPWDFVELPSQLMENFCWDREALEFFARHHKTGDPIPGELYDKMIAARNYMSASAFMRQLALGKLDLELHMHLSRYLDRDLDEIDREILAQYKVPLSTDPPTMARRFNHLFGDPTGYAAGYYSYKWAEVLDADAFTRFQADGVLNPATGRAFRESILSRGNSKPADELYRDFMGRNPELQPLLKRNGLA